MATIRARTLRALEQSPTALTAHQLMPLLQLEYPQVKLALQRQFWMGKLDRERSAEKGHPWLYTIKGRGFAGVRLFRDHRKNPPQDRDRQEVRRARGIARRLEHWGGFGKRHRTDVHQLECRVRFPDLRFGPEDRRPLTPREERKLWAWANRA